MQREDLIYLGTRLTIYLGLLAIGIAAGIQFAFMGVQNAVFTTTTIPLEQQAPDIYPVLLMLQTAINTAGIIGAGCLLLGGILDAYQDEVIAWTQ